MSDRVSSIQCLRFCTIGLAVVLATCGVAAAQQDVNDGTVIGNPEVSAPVTPFVFDGDVRDLAAPLPEDMSWARPNARVADALARWTAAVERQVKGVITKKVRRVVETSLNNWKGEQMPISRSWVDAEVDGLAGPDRDIAKLAIVLAKAPYQVDERMAEAVLGEDRGEERFIRILAWASFTGARRFVQLVAERSTSAQQTIVPFAMTEDSLHAGVMAA